MQCQEIKSGKARAPDNPISAPGKVHAITLSEYLSNVSALGMTEAFLPSVAMNETTIFTFVCAIIQAVSHLKYQKISHVLDVFQQAT